MGFVIYEALNSFLLGPVTALGSFEDNQQLQVPGVLEALPNPAVGRNLEEGLFRRRRLIQKRIRRWGQVGEQVLVVSYPVDLLADGLLVGRRGLDRIEHLDRLDRVRGLPDALFGGPPQGS